jgi:hypothetical protein
MTSKLGRVVGPGQAQEKPAYRLGGVRHEGGVILVQALMRNVGTCVSMRREKSKWERPHKDESTDAGHRGGVVRSSEESIERCWSQGTTLSSCHRGSTRDGRNPWRE